MILDPFLVVSVDRTTFCGVTARPQLALPTDQHGRVLAVLVEQAEDVGLESLTVVGR